MPKERLKKMVDIKVPVFEEKEVHVGISEILGDFRNDKLSPAETFNHLSDAEQENFKAITEKGDIDAISVVSNQYKLTQIRNTFKEALDSLPDEINGKVYYHSYTGRAGMRIFPNESDIGLWVMDGVNADTAVRVNFMQKVNGEDIFLPRDVAGFHRVHRGDVESEFEEFVDLIADVRPTWETIVEELSNREAKRWYSTEGGDWVCRDCDARDKLPAQPRCPECDYLSDIGTIRGAVGKNAAEDFENYIENWKRNFDGSMKSRNPPIWDLMLKAIKLVSRRNYSSGVHKEERLRKLSAKLFAHALKS